MINPDPKLYVDIADTPAKQSKGLMFVQNMPRDKGMLFSFSRSQPLSFWGENTLIPLDIAFVDSVGVIQNIDTIAPLNRKPVKSHGKCLYAIEANAGFFDENNIKAGYIVRLNNSERNLTCISFEKPKISFSRGNKKISQLMGNEYGFDMQDAQQKAESSRQRYESLPVISPDNIGEILVDQEYEDNSQQIVDQPSDIPDPLVPDRQLEPEPQIDDVPQFDNVFDAIEDFAKPTVENDFMGSPMRIEYVTRSGKGIAREIEPHGTFHADTTGNEILVSYDRTAGGIRAFIVQNIKAFALLNDKFEPKFRVEG